MQTTWEARFERALKAQSPQIKKMTAGYSLDDWLQVRDDALDEWLEDQSGPRRLSIKRAVTYAIYAYHGLFRREELHTNSKQQNRECLHEQGLSPDSLPVNQRNDQ